MAMQKWRCKLGTLFDILGRAPEPSAKSRECPPTKYAANTLKRYTFYIHGKDAWQYSKLQCVTFELPNV